METGLKSKVVIVTGAAGGIGRCTAELFAQEGARVIATDIRRPGDGLADWLMARDGCFVEHDVTDETAWERVMVLAREVFGGLDVLVNNAGTVRVRNLEVLTLAQWRQDNAVNLDSVFLGTRAAIMEMRTRGGAIINVSSVAAMTGVHTAAGYCAGKGGVRSFTKAAALHCAEADYAIRVNSVHPGYIETGMTQGLIDKAPDPERARRAFDSFQALGRMGSPDDVAAGILYLAGDSGRFVTGAELVIDGGYLAR